MAAKAGCVHLIFSKEARPEGRGQTTLTATPSCASRTPFLNQVLAGHRKSTESPQAIPQKPHSFHKAKMHTIPSQLFHHTAHTRAHLISCVGRAPPPSHNHTHFTPSLPFLRPYSLHNHTGLACLINCHGLTFDLLPRPPRHQQESEVTSDGGHAHLSSRGPMALKCHAHGSNKTCIKAPCHTHCTQAVYNRWTGLPD